MTLRDDIIAHSFTQSCLSQTRSKKLLIRCPVAIAEQLNPSHKHLDLFDATAYDADDTEDYIYLKTFPEYTTDTENLGEKGLRSTFNSSAVFAPVNTRPGFKATIKDRRKLSLYIIKYLADISETSSYNRFSPIKVVDFCHPEVTEANTFGGELATIKWGEISLDNQLPALTQVRGEDYVKTDWSFTFKETILKPGR